MKLNANIFIVFMFILLGVTFRFFLPNLEALSLIMLLLSVVLFVRDNSVLSPIYMGLVSTFTFLSFIIWITNGYVSFLTTQNDIAFYEKTLFLEIMFWSTFAIAMPKNPLKIKGLSPSKQNTPYFRFPTRWLLVISMLLFSIEVYISSNDYFKPYTEESNTGTVAFEIGCLLIGLEIYFRSLTVKKLIGSVFEVIAVAVALFISLASGKRLPLTYIILAYFIHIKNRFGKLTAMVLFFAVFFLGYVYGVARDSMLEGGLDSNSLLIGLEHSNQGAILHAASIYIRICQDGLATFGDRTISFFSNFIGALFIPLSFLPEQAQVNFFAMKYYVIQGNGGFIGSYAYFFLGVLGPCILSSLLALLFRSSGKWTDLVSMILILTSPRWTLYNVGPIFRLIGVTYLVFALLELVYHMRFRLFSLVSVKG